MGISTYELLNTGANMTPYIQILEQNIDGETIDWHINDQSWGLDQPYVQYMVETVDRLDDIIDLDFNLTSDWRLSAIDINLHDYSGQSYMGMAHFEWDDSSIWTSLKVVDWSTLGASENSNKNTFIHELGHALGLAEPGFDTRWNQDDTAMSYNEGDIGWQTWYTQSDLNALTSLWGAEDDLFANNLIGNAKADLITGQIGQVNSETMDGAGGNDTLRGYGGGDFLTGGNGDDLIGGNFGRDTLVGGAGDDVMNGGQGGDDLSGGSGADIIRGGAGKNTISAGANDGQIDEVFVDADSELYGRPTDGSFADLLNDLGANDWIYIHGVKDSGLRFQMASHPTGSEEGVGIYAYGALEAVVTGGLGVDQVSAMTEDGFF